MDMMGRVGLIEVPILIAPDQKVWMDRMIKEGKIEIQGEATEKGVKREQARSPHELTHGHHPPTSTLVKGDR